MSLYVITYQPNQRGCPLLFKGDINHDWTWDTYDPNPEKFEITQSYICRNKNPLIDFDFWNEQSVASAAFVSLCRKFGANIRTVSLEIIQSNKKRTEKDYFYLLWGDWFSVIDFEKSDVVLDRDLKTNEIIYDRYFPDVMRCDAIKKFVVDPKKLPDKQVFKCIDTDFELVCTEEFKQACEAAKLMGVGFQPLEEYQKIPWWHNDR